MLHIGFSWHCFRSSWNNRGGAVGAIVGIGLATRAADFVSDGIGQAARAIGNSRVGRDLKNKWEVVQLRKRMMHLYLDLNESISYHIDLDTLEIYTLEGNFRKTTLAAGHFGFIFAIIILPIIAWFIEPVRHNFNLYFLTRETNLAIIIITLITHLLLGLFLKEITRSNFVEKRILKINDENYNERMMEGLYPVNQTLEQRQALIKKSCYEKPLLVLAVLVAIAFLMPPIINRFINDSNALTYILFAMLSLVLVAPTAFMIRYSFIILKIARKEGMIKREDVITDIKEAVKNYVKDHPAAFFAIRISTILLGIVIFGFIFQIFETAGVSEDVFDLIVTASLIPLILIVIVPLFVSYCPNCKWIPTMRIILSPFNREHPCLHYCRKCEKRNVRSRGF